MRDMHQVLDALQGIDREVQAVDGRWYVMRIRPYRTIDDRIDGVVLMFQDITARRSAELSVERSEERLRLLIDSAIDYAIFTMTDDRSDRFLEHRRGTDVRLRARRRSSAAASMSVHRRGSRRRRPR